MKSSMPTNVNDSMKTVTSIPISTREYSLDTHCVQILFRNLLWQWKTWPILMELMLLFLKYRKKEPRKKHQNKNKCIFNSSNVSDDKALEVLESALSPEQLSKLFATFLVGVEIEDKMYLTWKCFKFKNMLQFCSKTS